MRIHMAIERERDLEVVIDGRKLSTHTRYVILEVGFAVYFLDEPSEDEEWLQRNGDVLPADPDTGRGALRSGKGMLVTSDPILVALAYESYWGRHGVTRPRNIALPIPLLKEAVEIVRNRKILSPENLKWAGKVPGLRFVPPTKVVARRRL